MNILTFAMLALVLGGGAYLILSGYYSQILLGAALISNGINLLLIESGHQTSIGTDPLPQALILTAIVIGFGIFSFLSAFIFNRIQSSGSDAVEPTKEEIH